MSDLNSEFVERYKFTDTEDLIKIAFIDKGTSYKAEAVEMAIKELLSRGITSQSEIVLEKIQKQTQEIQKQIEQYRIRDTETLEGQSKVIFFISGMVPLLFFIAMVFIIMQKEKRGKIRTKQSWKWLWLGAGSFYAVLLLIAVIR
jgi:ATP-dependent Zn protease